MAGKVEVYEIVLAHAGRRDETVYDTRTITTREQYDNLCDAIAAMNAAMQGREDKAYYAIRLASQGTEQ